MFSNLAGPSSQTIYHALSILPRILCNVIVNCIKMS